MKSISKKILIAITFALTQLAGFDVKKALVPYGIYLNRNLDYVAFQSDTLIIAGAFSMSPCTSLYEQQGDRIIAEMRSRQQGKTLYLATVIAEGREVPLEILFDPSPWGCHPHVSSVDTIFHLADESLHPRPWDSLLIEVSMYHSLFYSAKIDSSGVLHIIQSPTDAEHIDFGLSVSDSLLREISLIHGAQFSLWDGEVSDGQPLQISIYRNGKAERYTGSILPFYYRHLNRFLVELDQLFVEWKQ